MFKTLIEKYLKQDGFKKLFLDMKNRLFFYINVFKSWSSLNKKNDNEFFKSEQTEYLFYLTKLEGKQRNKLLGLRDEHYQNEQVAKKWYKKIAKLVHPDKDGNNEAFNTLCKIYEVLIEKE